MRPAPHHAAAAPPPRLSKWRQGSLYLLPALPQLAPALGCSQRDVLHHGPRDMRGQRQSSCQLQQPVHGQRGRPGGSGNEGRGDEGLLGLQRAARPSQCGQGVGVAAAQAALDHLHDSSKQAFVADASLGERTRHPSEDVVREAGKPWNASLSQIPEEHLVRSPQGGVGPGHMGDVLRAALPETRRQDLGGNRKRIGMRCIEGRHCPDTIH
mmetsp:Transcript_21225/g.51269  ORF Transcript_21225/g.51269 Transcript_21225/m.51269 type:complete len:211 (+) Transcript_21225:37-669(+)